MKLQQSPRGGPASSVPELLSRKLNQHGSSVVHLSTSPYHGNIIGIPDSTQRLSHGMAANASHISGKGGGVSARDDGAKTVLAARVWQADSRREHTPPAGAIASIHQLWLGPVGRVACSAESHLSDGGSFGVPGSAWLLLGDQSSGNHAAPGTPTDGALLASSNGFVKSTQISDQGLQLVTSNAGCVF